LRRKPSFLSEELWGRVKKIDLPYKEEMVDYCLEIIKAYSPECIIVHGSIAKGNYILNESDVDVLIISEKFEGKPMEERFSELLEYGTGRKVFFEALAFTKKEALKRVETLNQLLLDALFFGKVIYDRGFYVALLKKFKKIAEKHKLEKIEDGWKFS